MMLPRHMHGEFLRHWQELKPTEGTLPARRMATDRMLTDRRARLVTLLNEFQTYDRVEMITKLTAEISLLLIERGA
jgi:hypothetical protein